MDIKISEELGKILDYAKEEAMRTGSYSIGTDHLMLAILRCKDSDVCKVLDAAGIDRCEFKEFLDSRLFRKHCIPAWEEDNVSIGKSARNTLNLTILEAGLAKHDKAFASDLMLAVCRSLGSLSESYLRENGVNRDSLNSDMAALFPDSATPVSDIICGPAPEPSDATGGSIAPQKKERRVKLFSISIPKSKYLS